MNNVFTAPTYTLKSLNNIFIELTSKNCNQKCKSCYIDFPIQKNVKDFISFDCVKKALYELKDKKINCIYLTGAEPMTHPDFNLILRLCLKKYNVCICTNGSFLNEKKIRFLKKVEDEGQNQIFFNLSLAHYNEIENDKAKYRGNFRQTIFSLKTLCRYNFISMLTVQNYYGCKKEELKENFSEIFAKNDIYNTEIKIIPHFEKDKNLTDEIKIADKTDCMYGRVITGQGIYVCPFLSGDYRGRNGSSFNNFSKNFTAETDFCTVCSQNNDFIFTIGE